MGAAALVLSATCIGAPNSGHLTLLLAVSADGDALTCLTNHCNDNTMPQESFLRPSWLRFLFLLFFMSFFEMVRQYRYPESRIRFSSSFPCSN
jgi:hypothetical protein